MNRFQQSLFGLVSGGLLIAGCASTDRTIPSAPASDMVLRMDGGGGWDLRCEGQTTRGDAKVHERGRRSDKTGVIAMEDVVTMRCDYDAGTAPLLLTLEDTGIACPFGTFSEGVCRAEFSASTTGTLEFAPKR